MWILKTNGNDFTVSLQSDASIPCIRPGHRRPNSLQHGRGEQDSVPVPACVKGRPSGLGLSNEKRNEILPGLFLGPYSAAMKSKLPALERQGVTHIVCVRQDIEANFIKPNFPHTFRYLVLDIADNPVENIIRFFPMTKEFVDSCLANGGKVLVHGNAGISRSAALVIAYLMETFGMKYRDAFSYVQERRFCINPNVGFVNQLQEYEAIYLAKLTIKMMTPVQLGRSFSLQTGMPGSRKRSLEEDEDFGGMQVTAAQNG